MEPLKQIAGDVQRASGGRGRGVGLRASRRGRLRWTEFFAAILAHACPAGSKMAPISPRSST